jgi:hypothetical protein
MRRECMSRFGWRGGGTFTGECHSIEETHATPRPMSLDRSPKCKSPGEKSVARNRYRRRRMRLSPAARPLAVREPEHQFDHFEYECRAAGHGLPRESSTLGAKSRLAGCMSAHSRMNHVSRSVVSACHAAESPVPFSPTGLTLPSNGHTTAGHNLSLRQGWCRRCVPLMSNVRGCMSMCVNALKAHVIPRQG